MSPVFTEVSIIVVLATALGILAHLFRQPTILGYLLAGLVIGPLGYLHFDSHEVLDGFAEIGIALLLFMIGLELNIKEVRHLGKPALVIGMGQVLFTFGIGFVIATQVLGFAPATAAFIATALAFSSTIIVVKLLHEKNDLHSLYGKVVIGVLLIQDVIAIFALVFISGLGESSELTGSLDQFILLIAKGLLITGGILWAGKKVFPWILDKIGQSQETLFTFSLAWGLGFATFMSTELIGFSLEIGGLLAGLALANSAEHFQISGRIRPLRDFFILMFFVVLGSEMALANMGEILLPAILLSLFVLIGNPLIVMTLMAILGFRPRTSFLSSMALAQISEFSLIIIILGERVGAVSDAVVSLITLVAVITIVISSYMIWNSNKLYEKLRPYLGFLAMRKDIKERIGHVEDLENHVVLIGADRMGSGILHVLEEIEHPFIVVDFNPAIVKKLRQDDINVVYGDIIDQEIQERAVLDKAKLVISTISDIFDTSALLHAVRAVNKDAKIILTADNDWQGLRLYKEGADYVLLPHFLGGRHLAYILSQDHSFQNLQKLRVRDMKAIKDNLIY